MRHLMMFTALVLLTLTGGVRSADATEFYVAKTGSNGNSCTAAQNPATPKLTLASALTCESAGDTIWMGDGVYTEGISSSQITAGTSPTNRTAIRAINNGQVTLRPSGGSQVVLLTNRPYIHFSGMIFDGINNTNNPLKMESGSHHILLEDMRFTNSATVGLLTGGSTNGIVRRSRFDHNGNGNLEHGIYLSTGADDWLIEQSEFDHNAEKGIQVYPHPKRVTIRGNYLHDNCQDPPDGGNEIDLSDTDHIVENNLIVVSTCTKGIFAYWRGPSGSTIRNNRIYCKSGACTAGIHVGDPAVNFTVQNNHVIGFVNNIDNDGTGTTLAGNRTTGSITDCTISTTDFRMKTGTNPCRDAGVAIAGVPSVGAPDIGAWEQGVIASAVSTSGFIEVTINVKTPGVLPTSGITGFTINNGTSTGTPVVTSAVVKPVGANNIVQLTTSGFTGSGTCTINYSPGNLTDSGYVGLPSSGWAQGPNTVSSLAVSGTCDNSAGGTPPAPGGLHVHHTVNEGSGTSLNDETANNLDSTISGATWTTTGVSGNGLAFAADQDQRITFAYGDTINPTTQSFSYCVWVKATAALGKIVMGPPIGTDQRFYVGVHSGSSTWGIGIGASTISSTGASEFPMTANWTRLCVVNNSATDTATLYVDKVKGTSASSAKSSASVTDLAGDFLIGCGFSGTLFCGGYEIDEPKIWTIALSDAEVAEDFDSYTPPGPSEGGYAQKAHRWQEVYKNVVGDVVTIGTATDVKVVAGGAVAVEMQVDCTGGDCDPLAIQLHASDIAGNTSAIPQTMGALGIAMWGTDPSIHLNSGVSTCCITGALTATNGVTILNAVASETIQLAQNSSKMFRWVVQVGSDQAGETFILSVKQDNGAALSGAAGTNPTITVIPMRMGM